MRFVNSLSAVPWLASGLIRVGAGAVNAQAPVASSPAQSRAAASACNTPSAEPVVELELPGTPFEPVVTVDGCWIFVTLAAGTQRASGQVAVVRRDSGGVHLVRTVAVEGNPTGAVLTHDGRTLLVADGPVLAFLDAASLISGNGDPVIGYLRVGGQPGFINVNVTADDRLLFASAERAHSILVVDLARARDAGIGPAAVVGRVPVGNAPIALAFSPDEKLLFTTSESVPPVWDWPRVCRTERASEESRAPPSRGRQLPAAPPNHARGAVFVISVDSAALHPMNAVLSAVAAGCEPVRLALSPDGATAYVSARGDDELLAFDTRRLLADTAHALVGKVKVGVAPVGLAVADSGRRIFVTNSNRFAGDASDRQPVAIVDAARLAAGGSRAKLGTIRAGAFPRELRVSPDGRTLFVMNFASRTLEMIDLARVR
jgi:DNA-binding beta-propeller fold protein YncE